MIEHFDKIWWEESYLLGWERESDTLTLFLELYVAEGHPAFEPYDKRKEFGCYKTARLVVNELRRADGLPSDHHGLKRNAALGEYEDAGSIAVMTIAEESLAVAMHVSAARSADDFLLEVQGLSADLIFADI